MDTRENACFFKNNIRFGRDLNDTVLAHNRRTYTHTHTHTFIYVASRPSIVHTQDDNAFSSRLRDARPMCETVYRDGDRSGYIYIYICSVYTMGTEMCSFFVFSSSYISRVKRFVLFIRDEAQKRRRRP